MKRYSLLDSLLVAMTLLVGMSELAQVPAIAVRLAHRTAAPLVRLARLGHTPSSPDSPLPAAQPFVVEAQDACARPSESLPVVPADAPRVRIAPVVVRVVGIPAAVETVSDPVAATAFVAPNPAPFLRLVQLRTASLRQISETRLRARMEALQQTMAVQPAPELSQRDLDRIIARALAEQARAERVSRSPVAPSPTAQF